MMVQYMVHPSPPTHWYSTDTNINDFHQQNRNKYLGRHPDNCATCRMGLYPSKIDDPVLLWVI